MRNYDTDDQTEQHRIMDDIMQQQDIRNWYGECQGGCRAENIIYGWPVALAMQCRRRGEGRGGFDWICEKTRLPCEKQKLAPIYELYSKVNRCR